MTGKLSPWNAGQNKAWGKVLSLPLSLAFLLTPLLGLLAFQATPARADGWVIECVDCPPESLSSMTDRSLQLDDAGHPHIAYGGENRLYYAWHNGSSWHYEIVDGSPRVNLRAASLALDGNSHPHISYGCYDYGSSDENLKYAYRDSFGWHIEVVDRAGYTGRYTSLVLDEDGYPHISYLHISDYDGNRDLKYAYRDASGWRIRTVDGGEHVGEHSSLALDGGVSAH